MTHEFRVIDLNKVRQERERADKLDALTTALREREGAYAGALRRRNNARESIALRMGDLRDLWNLMDSTIYACLPDSEKNNFINKREMLRSELLSAQNEFAREQFAVECAKVEYEIALENVARFEE